MDLLFGYFLQPFWVLFELVKLKCYVLIIRSFSIDIFDYLDMFLYCFPSGLRHLAKLFSY